MSDSKTAGFMIVAIFMIATIGPISNTMIDSGDILGVQLGAVWPYLALVMAVMALGFALQDVFKRY